MVSIDSSSVQASPPSTEPNSSPRISFSSEFLDESNFISITPNSHTERDQEIYKRSEKLAWSADFEFLSNKVSSHSMIAADELFFEGKLLPFWEMQQQERLNKITLKSPKHVEEDFVEIEVKKEAENKVNWFLDDDPSPRPPKCTVLWKELLRLKKQRAVLSPSSSSSSSSSSSKSMADAATTEEGKEGKTAINKDKNVKRMKKGLERTRSASIRIRPMINVPICTQVKSSVLPPLFPLKKGRFEMRR